MLITVKQFAERRGIAMCRVRELIMEGRIEGAQKVGREWLIPSRAIVGPTQRAKAKTLEGETSP